MTTITDAAAGTSAISPEALLKAAVSGGKPAEAAEPAGRTVAKAGRRVAPLTMGLAGAGLALGTLLGAGTAILAMPRSEGTGLILAEINAGLEANRLEAARLAVASDRLDKSIAALKEASDAARSDAKARGAALTEKVGKVEAALVAKIATVGERIDQAEKDQGARMASLALQAEKRAVAVVPTPAVAKAEPVQTGSIPEAKPKPAIIESWAVRDVYDGTAMLEDRRRRLIEVAAGGSIPGIGRVEGIERRGRDWVVVTRQGLVTAQPW